MFFLSGRRILLDGECGSAPQPLPCRLLHGGQELSDPGLGTGHQDPAFKPQVEHGNIDGMMNRIKSISPGIQTNILVSRRVVTDT